MTVSVTTFCTFSAIDIAAGLVKLVLRHRRCHGDRVGHSRSVSSAIVDGHCHCVHVIPIGGCPLEVRCGGEC